MRIEIELNRSHLMAAVLSAAIVFALNASATGGDTKPMQAASVPVLPMTPSAAAPVAATSPGGSQLAPAAAPVLPTSGAATTSAASAGAPEAAAGPQQARAVPRAAEPARATPPAPRHKAWVNRRRPAPKVSELASLDVPPLTPSAIDAIRRSNAWASNEAATVDGASDGRVIFTYGETMPTIVCAPLRVCDIELQPGEKVIGVPDVGDSVRWGISPAHSGSGADEVTHVIVKPHEAGLDTNLVIATDRRMYHLRLVSSPTNYVSDVAFSYPADDKAAWDATIAANEAKKSDVVATLPKLTADALNFSYSIKDVSGSPKWMPLRVFDDGSHTYIQMPPGMAATEAPVLVLLDKSGDEQLVDYRLRGDYFVVDRIIDRAALEAGVGHSRDRVVIKRVTCVKRGFFGGCKD